MVVSRKTNDDNIIDNCYGAIKMGILEFCTFSLCVCVCVQYDHFLFKRIVDRI